MRTTTREASPGLERCSIPNRSGTDGSILVQKMRVLCAAAFAEIFDLHNFGKRGNVSIGLSSFGIIVSFEDFLILRDAINGVKRSDYNDSLGEKHLCASISEGIFVDLLASRREISAPFPRPL